MKKKRRNIILIILGGLILSSLGGAFYLFKKKAHADMILEMQQHYGELVYFLRDAKIYEKQDKGYQEYGSAKEGLGIRLESQTIDDKSDGYFKIKDEEIYVYYKDVDLSGTVVASISDYYLPSSSVIKSKEVTNLYQDNLLVVSLSKEKEFHYYYQTDDAYVVEYFDQLLKLKKEDVELIPSEVNIEQANFISVVQIPEVNDTCSSGDCISKDHLKEFLDLVRSNNKYAITTSDYSNWLQGGAALKEGAMLLVCKSENDELSSVLSEYGYLCTTAQDWKLSLNNKATNRDSSIDALDSYALSENTTTDQMQKMVNGETIEPPKKVVTTTSVAPKGLPNENAKATQIAVLNYHFFYDESKGEWCGEGNCLEVAKFREQLDYLKKNHYKTLTMEEYRAWMYGEIELPARSVLLTVDDGAMGTGKHNGNKLIPILEEYDMHATLFLITGWWAKENYISKNLDIESHTYDMHKEGQCTGEARGAQLLCSSKEQVMKDLSWSIDITGSNKAFCFPFYAYNASTLQSVKEAGFQLAFIGGSVKSNRNHDKYKIPRYPIHSNITLNQFINMIA